MLNSQFPKSWTSAHAMPLEESLSANSLYCLAFASNQLTLSCIVKSGNICHDHAPPEDLPGLPWPRRAPGKRRDWPARSLPGQRLHGKGGESGGKESTAQRT